MKNSEFMNLLLVTGKVSKENTEILNELGEKLDNTPYDLHRYYEKYCREANNYKVGCIFETLSNFIEKFDNKELSQNIEEFLDFSLNLFCINDTSFLIYVIGLCDSVADMFALRYRDRFGKWIMVDGKMLKIVQVYAPRLSGGPDRLDIQDSQGNTVAEDILCIKKDKRSNEIVFISRTWDKLKDKRLAEYEYDKFKIIFN